MPDTRAPATSAAGGKWVINSVAWVSDMLVSSAKEGFLLGAKAKASL
jgi:hypothetical protein